MGFKLVILLMWAAIPAAVWLLVEQDRERYLSEGQAQRGLLLRREAEISNQAARLRVLALELGQVSDEEQLRRWRSSWAGQQREQQRALPVLGGAALDHFPRCAQLLDEQFVELGRLSRELDLAARSRDYYLRSFKVLYDLNRQADFINHQARVYRDIPNGRGIYLLLQEELAKLEQRILTQERERERLFREGAAQLNALIEDSQALRRELAALPELERQDAARTYLASVRERWRRFSLRDELAHLLAEQARAAHSQN